MNKMQSTYSLIVPHFNDPIRLERLLYSVPIERGDVEVIVVDDCSTDHVAFDAVRVRWPSVRWLSTRENMGAGVARNVALDAATGRWLVFADSDDEFLPGAFKTFDQALREDDQLAYFLAEAVQEVDRSPSRRAETMNDLVATYIVSGDASSEQRLRLHHVVPWAKVYSRAYVEENCFRFDPVRNGNDVAFNVLSAIQARRVCAFPKPVYRIYRRPKSLTSDLSYEVFMQRFRVSVLVAQRLETLGYKGVWPGTGQMMMSLRYGPRVTIKVWWLVLRSPMKVNIFRILEPSRWRKYLLKSVEKNRQPRIT